MKTTLYTVTVTDLGTYRITVAADSTDEAVYIAKEVLCEEATQLPEGVSLIKRDTDAIAELASQPVQTYRVRATYELDFSMMVPASTREEAVRHAKRIYAINYGPFEFEHNGDGVSPFYAEAVS